ncbi:MAG: alpha/beta fold hydrolase, partial [Burkholderiales bacterium]
FEKTDMRTRLGRYHDEVEATFRGWNDIWLSPEFRSWNIEEYLPGVTCPVLLIQGEDDEYGTLEQIRSIEEKVSGRIERVIFPRCAHSPHVDQEKAALEAISRFLNRTAQFPMVVS